MTREEVKNILHSRTAHRVCADSTMMSYNKDELVAIIRMLEHNWACAVVTLDQQAENIKEFTLNNQWVRVKEKRPPNLQKVLTCDEHGNIHIMDDWWGAKVPFGITENNMRYYPPKWWMFLPEPPKEVKNDGGSDINVGSKGDLE